MPLVLICFLFVVSCAHRPVLNNKDPRLALHEICQIGNNIDEVRGSAWLKIKSPNKSGQFPANIFVKSPNQLQLEVTNLLGGREAFIKYEKNKVKIERPNQETTQEKLDQSELWNGLPLQWAITLFLGRFPCPSEKEEKLIIEITDKDELKIQQQNTHETETFLYQLKKWQDKPWVKALIWEKKNSTKNENALQITFSFDRPEETTLSPKKWEIVSSHGEIKFRWKDRQITFNP